MRPRRQAGRCARAAAAPVAALLVLAGCVSKTIEPEYRPRVATTVSDGEVELSWKSDPGYEYTVVHLDPETGVWRPVKGGKVYGGTGETIAVRERLRPGQPLPWYSVKAEKRRAPPPR